MSEPSLKPCPFCGHRATNPHMNAGLWWISCTHCEAEVSHGIEASVVTQWNTRAQPEPAAHPTCKHGIRWPHECKDCIYGEPTAHPELPAVRIYWHAYQGWQVEWLTTAPNGGQSNYFSFDDEPIGSRRCAMQWAAWKSALAAQAQRAPEPLADARVVELGGTAFGIDIALDGNLMRFARAVEAAHGIAASPQPETPHES